MTTVLNLFICKPFCLQPSVVVGDNGCPFIGEISPKGAEKVEQVDLNR